MSTGTPAAPPEPQRVSQEIDQKRVAPSEEATQAMRKLAEQQHGVLAQRQLLAIGLSEALIQERVRSGRLIRLHRGVFAVGHRRISRLAEWLAAVLACGPSAVLSHATAAHLWDLRGSRGPIEVSRIAGHRRPHGVRLHQPRSLLEGDTTSMAGVPVTSIERTLMDVAGRFDARQLERMVVAADRSGQLRWPELARVLKRGRGRKGVGRLRRVVEEVDPRAVETVSPLEIDFLALCRQAGLPLPKVNVWAEGFLVDFLWPTQRVVVETDGYSYHGDPGAFERDHERTIALTAADYEVHRATYRMLDRDPAPFLGIVRRSLATRGR